MHFADDHSRMNHYLISFPASAMNHITADDFPSVVESSHAVIREAKAAGVYVFGGGIDETIPPEMVTGSGKVTPGSYPETRTFNGGFCVIKVNTREDLISDMPQCACGVAHQVSYLGSKMRSPKTEVIHEIGRAHV